MVRIGGLASGMDIDTMVSDLMKAERMPLDKLKQKKQTLEWQRDDYRSMNTLLLNFRSELTSMKLSTKYRARLATSTDDTKLTATASSAASLSSYSISEVSQLASAATKVNTGKISATKIDENKKLSETNGDFLAGNIKWEDGKSASQNFETSTDSAIVSMALPSGETILTTVPVGEPAPINVKVNGVAYKVVTGSPVQGKKEVSVASDGTLTFSDSIAKGSTVKVDYISPSTTEKYSSFSIKTFDSNGGSKMENIFLSGEDTLSTVMSKVNSSSVGVTLFYDSFSDQMTMTRKETGDFNKPVDPDNPNPDGSDTHEIIVNGDFATKLLKFDANAKETGGTNAKFTVNGLKTERTSNTFDISGVTFTLKRTFSDAPASISVSNNTNQVFDNIKGFVDKYNELIGKIQGEVQEERYKSYTPLTDEQRESLSDKQQEQWEEKAKSGLLRRDPTLSSLLTKMRSDFGTPVSNSEVNTMYKQLASIGIKTTANYQEGGKLQIDEAALKKAIEADPTSIEKLFNATGTSMGEKGIAQRLTDTVNGGLDKLRSKAGNSFTTNKQFELGKLLETIDKNIDSFEDRLTKVESRYWARFTAMEKAIQRSNEQMAQLSNFSS